MRKIDMTPVIHAHGLKKTFILRTQGGTTVDVFKDVALDVSAGECVSLHGPSGAGKSTLLRALYANYRPDAGHIVVRHGSEQVDMVCADLWKIIEVRKRTIGYVSQFLRVIPRVSTLDVVAGTGIAVGMNAAEARSKAQLLLTRLNINPRLWSLAPATFSGGEQQRVNVARGFMVEYPVLLLDEPTASLDATNRNVVVELIAEAKGRGAAIIGIFHDDKVRASVSDRLILIGGAAGSGRPHSDAPHSSRLA